MPLINKNEKTSLENKMAGYLNAHLSNEELMNWNIRALDMTHEYLRDSGKGHKSSSTEFLCSFTYSFIPSVLKAKSSTQRTTTIKRELPKLFKYAKLKPSLTDVGQAIMHGFGKANYLPADIEALMKQHSCFMVLSEMYEEYRGLDDNTSNA